MTDTEIIEKLKNATETYNGKADTCACGCAGTYADAKTPKGIKRINQIIDADPEKVSYHDFGGGEGCLDLENRTGTRVTRIYIKETK